MLKISYERAVGGPAAVSGGVGSFVQVHVEVRISSGERITGQAPVQAHQDAFLILDLVIGKVIAFGTGNDACGEEGDGDQNGGNAVFHKTNSMQRRATPGRYA